MDKSRITRFTIPLFDSLALRIYSDSRPFNWKIAELQKGLILVSDGREVVGAGAGFGFPFLVYPHETYFSGSSRAYVDRHGCLTTIRKEFFMDRIKRNRFSCATLESQKARNTLDYIGILYRKRFRFLRLKNLLVRLGVKTKFFESRCVGKVIVTYVISQKHIQVKSDFSHLERDNLKRIFLLNEQGSRFFRVYLDSDGTRLVDREIGHWEVVKAKWAGITDSSAKIGFRLENLQGTILRRGQEFIDGFLDWIGLDYEVHPRTKEFEYGIEVIG